MYLTYLIFQNSKLTEELYAAPWYYLPAKHQKTFLIFLYLTQRPKEMRIFKIYPITFELIPKILKQIYDFVALIWGIEKKWGFTNLFNFKISFAFILLFISLNNFNLFDIKIHIRWIMKNTDYIFKLNIRFKFHINPNGSFGFV